MRVILKILLNLILFFYLTAALILAMLLSLILFIPRIIEGMIREKAFKEKHTCLTILTILPSGHFYIDRFFNFIGFKILDPVYKSINDLCSRIEKDSKLSED